MEIYIAPLLLKVKVLSMGGRNPSLPHLSAFVITLLMLLCGRPNSDGTIRRRSNLPLELQRANFDTNWKTVILPNPALYRLSLGDCMFVCFFVNFYGGSSWETQQMRSWVDNKNTGSKRMGFKCLWKIDKIGHKSCVSVCKAAYSDVLSCFLTSLRIHFKPRKSFLYLLFFFLAAI